MLIYITYVKNDRNAECVLLILVIVSFLQGENETFTSFLKGENSCPTFPRTTRIYILFQMHTMHSSEM